MFWIIVYLKFPTDENFLWKVVSYQLRETVHDEVGGYYCNVFLDHHGK